MLFTVVENMGHSLWICPKSALLFRVICIAGIDKDTLSIVGIFRLNRVHCCFASGYNASTQIRCLTSVIAVMWWETTDKMALDMMRLRTSQTLIGRTAGFSSSGTSLQDVMAAIPFEFTLQAHGAFCVHGDRRAQVL